MSGAKPGPAPSWFPLRRQILDSSIWEENPTVRVLWVTILLVASEPGRRGTADMTLRSLSARACLSPEDTKAALDVLMAPDPRSRTKDNDGRRIEPIDPTRDWGWRLVNWERYERDRDAAGSTLRQRRYREGHTESVTKRNGTSRNLTTTSEEIEKEKEKEKENKKERAALRRFAVPSLEDVRTEVARRKLHVDPEAFVAFYESKGWRVGSAPMRSWQAALTTWEKRNGANGTPVSAAPAVQIVARRPDPDAEMSDEEGIENQRKIREALRQRRAELAAGRPQ